MERDEVCEEMRQDEERKRGGTFKRCHVRFIVLEGQHGFDMISILRWTNVS